MDGITIIKPITGGGLGDYKIGIIEVDVAKYTPGGYDVGAAGDSVFCVSSGSALCKIVNGKLKFFTSPGVEMTGDGQFDYPSGTVFCILKG